MLITNIVEALCLKAKNLTSSECPEKDEIVAAILAVMTYLEKDVIREHLRWKPAEKGAVMSDATLVKELAIAHIANIDALNTELDSVDDVFHEKIKGEHYATINAFRTVLEYLAPEIYDFSL